MKKFKVILLSFILIIFSVSIGLSAFLLLNSKIIINITSDQTTKYKVTFTDNGEIKKTMFVDSGYNLSLKDAPYYFNSSGNPIKWYSKDYNLLLNDFNSDNYNSITDYEIEFAVDTSGFNGNEIMTSDINSSTGGIESVSQYVISSKISLPYNSSGDIFVEVKDDNQKKLVNGDTTIGLDNNQNYITLRIENDIYLYQGTITIGAQTGFFGSDSNWCQINWQGFIIGNYSSIDLNGHDLIIASNSTLDSYGLITDSSINKSGNLILTNGSVLYTNFVIEDHYREQSMPTSYINNGSLFSMYRCPYWSCNTIIYDGAQVYGKIRIYFCNLGAVVSNRLYLSGDVYLLGSGGTNFDWPFSANGMPWVQFNSNSTNSFITRKCENNDLENNTTVSNNWLWQNITYDFNSMEITLNPLKMTLDSGYVASIVGSIKVDFFFDKTSLYVPPYFDFRLGNSNLYLNQKINFLPNSSLYVDEGSSIHLSYSNIKEAGEVEKINMAKQEYQSVGGLNFIDQKYLINSTIAKWIDTRKGDSDPQEGYGDIIFFNNDINSYFWSQLSSAYCDLYGKIQFDENGNIAQYHAFELGGNINIYKLDDFNAELEKKKSSLDIQLFAASFTDGPNMSFYTGFMSLKTSYRLNITSYYVLPLISNGYVVPDIVNGKYNNIANDTMIYDSNNGIVSVLNNGIPYKYFAFIFDDYGNPNNLYKSNHTMLNNAVKDSLSGTFKMCSLMDNNTKIMLNDNSQYIFFCGAFLPGDGNTNTYSIAKFQGYNSSRISSSQTFTYNSAQKRWLIQ